MRTLIVAEHISLDGVIQSPGGPEEDQRRIPPRWLDSALRRRSHRPGLQDLFSQPFALLLGRRTYDMTAAYWPRVPVDSDSRAIADLFNSVPKHVATHRSDTLAWQNSHALEGDLADAIRALKQQDGANLLTHGSGDMVPTACSRVGGRASAYDLSRRTWARQALYRYRVLLSVLLFTPGR